VHPDTRASNSEREAVVDRLVRALQDGRLSPEEFEERAARAYAARVHGELAVLVGDLPGHLW
jgi:predicted RNA-binding protein associated with RNAse of E/G family